MNAIVRGSRTTTKIRRLSPKQQVSGFQRCGKSTKTSSLPPLPPSSSSATSSSAGKHGNNTILSPAQAKKRYLESKQRTEEFLRDPQGKMTQLQSELDEVKAQAIQKLEREVYNKTVWQRLTDPIKRKQHSFINMVCATFAYVLAYNLHLKSKAHKDAVRQADEERAKTQELKTLLRSLVEEETIHKIADNAMKLDDSSTQTNDKRKKQRNSSLSKWWASSLAASSNANRASTDKDKLVTALRSVLAEKIGDEGLDDDTKKQKNLQRIWNDNQEELRRQKQQQQEQQQSKMASESSNTDVEENEILALPVQILLLEGDDDGMRETTSTTNDDGKAPSSSSFSTASSLTSPSSSTSITPSAERKQRRVLDM